MATANKSQGSNAATVKAARVEKTACNLTCLSMANLLGRWGSIRVWLSISALAQTRAWRILRPEKPAS
jgi:hypothetical protein